MTGTTVERLTSQDVGGVRAVWNEVVATGDAFPQTDELGADEAAGFFAAQSFTGVARGTGDSRVLGVHVLRPNSIGRCGHIANASHAVASSGRGRDVGERLGLRALQSNAVVSTDRPARALYERLGFTEIGHVPGGFRRDGGEYVDTTLHYADLTLAVRPAP